MNNSGIAAAYERRHDVPGLSPRQASDLDELLWKTAVPYVQRMHQLSVERQWRIGDKVDELTARFHAHEEAIGELADDLKEQRVSAAEAGKRWVKLKRAIDSDAAKIEPLIKSSEAVEADINDPVSAFDRLVDLYPLLRPIWPI
jgi:hypothetical protein